MMTNARLAMSNSYWMQTGTFPSQLSPLLMLLQLNLTAHPQHNPSFPSEVQQMQGAMLRPHPACPLL